MTTTDMPTTDMHTELPPEVEYCRIQDEISAGGASQDKINKLFVRLTIIYAELILLGKLSNCLLAQVLAILILNGKLIDVCSNGKLIDVCLEQSCERRHLDCQLLLLLDSLYRHCRGVVVAQITVDC